MVVGCDAEGTVTDENSRSEFCRTRCSTRGNAVNGNCTGDGCCQKSLPLLRKSFDLTVSNIKSTHFNACSYAFVAEDGSYKFEEDDLLSFQSTADIRMKLEWALGEETCSEAKLSPLYACSRNTTCVESSRGYGYLCSCLDGYQGNPYSSQGCQDIDECSYWKQTICFAGASCRNKPGGYDCICPKGSFIGKLGCHKPGSVAHVIAASISLAAIMAACISWCYWVYRKRKLLKLRANYFLRNGGLLLQQHLCPRKGLTSKHPKIFSAEELKLATENYKSSRVLGHGGHGTVYQGTLKDGTVVAVKKSQVVAQDKLDQFINELIIQTQINHRNIVKLLGCCLETQVPLLVYEYIPNGTLHQNLHQGPEFPRLPWKDRLRIATEVAEALSYLHSYASMPIFHRDVKSSNILLDQNSTAKLADFGISRLVPIDKDQVSTAVLGTIGYIDPAYFNSGKLTEKSDVYSFGVVLLELLTGKKPIIQDVSQDSSSLVVHFQSHNNSGKLLEILDEEIVKEGAIEQVLAIAEIARSCVSSEGEKRPSMKRVMQEFTYIGKYIPSINEANDAGVHLHREIHSVKCIGFLTGS
ncbi:wall-associated receptor kinase 3-like [Aristolochia californica]|uniref:wall-associated receptor kinase 3-like n=1 Tax=Aristolochia californica TaxID=171875 RepID=UPI0035D6B6A6